MKITLKFSNEIKEYNTVKEAEQFLNEANYYAERLELLYSFEDAVIYDNKTVLSDLQKEANTYGNGWIEVFQIFE